MDETDLNLVRALLAHANGLFVGDSPDNLGRERELDSVKQSTRLAEKIAAGKANDDDRAQVPEFVHASVRSRFGL